MIVLPAHSARTWISIAVLSVMTILVWQLGIFVDRATPEPFPRADHLAYGMTLTACAVLMIGVMLRWEQASWSSVGLVAPVKGVVLGMSWWLVPAVVGLTVATVAGLGQVSLIAQPSDAVVRFAALIALVFLCEALPEELIFRGFIQTRLTGLVGVWGGVLIQAGLFTGFAILIGAAPDLMQVGFIATFGVALGMLRTATGTLWAPIGFHLVFMTVQQSHGAGWDLVVLTLPEMTRMLVLAQVPFGVVIALLFSRIGRERTA